VAPGTPAASESQRPTQTCSEEAPKRHSAPETPKTAKRSALQGCPEVLRKNVALIRRTASNLPWALRGCQADLCMCQAALCMKEAPGTPKNAK